MREDGGGGTLSQSGSVELAVRGVVVLCSVILKLAFTHTHTHTHTQPLGASYKLRERNIK